MIKIYGYSDDLLEVEGDFEEEYAGYDKWISLKVGTDDIGMIVRARYGVMPSSGACWFIGIEPIDDSTPMFPAEIWRALGGYSPMLMIGCSEGTPVTRIDE